MSLEQPVKLNSKASFVRGADPREQQHMRCWSLASKECSVKSRSYQRQEQACLGSQDKLVNTFTLMSSLNFLWGNIFSCLTSTETSLHFLQKWRQAAFGARVASWPAGVARDLEYHQRWQWSQVVIATVLRCFFFRWTETFLFSLNLTGGNLIHKIFFPWSNKPIILKATLDKHPVLFPLHDFETSPRDNGQPRGEGKILADSSDPLHLNTASAVLYVLLIFHCQSKLQGTGSFLQGTHLYLSILPS